MEEEEFGRGHEQLKGGVLAGKFLAGEAEGRVTRSGSSRASPAVPALDERVNGMLAGLGALKSKIKVVSKLETDCDQTKGATAAQTMLTANQNLTAIYSACGPPAFGAIQSIKNAGIKPGGIILVGFDASPDEVKADQGRNRDRKRRPAPRQDRIPRGRDALRAVQGKRVPKNVDTGTALVTKANAGKFGERRTLRGRPRGSWPARRARRPASTVVIVDTHQHFWNSSGSRCRG